MVNTLRSSNTLTIPLIDTTFSFTPLEFEYKKKYTLTCNFFSKPVIPVETVFMFENSKIATIKNGGTSFEKKKGLKMYPVDKSDNSIIIKPSSRSNNGTYYCEFHFNFPGITITKFESQKITTNFPAKKKSIFNLWKKIG